VRAADIALAAQKVSEIATWLGETDDARTYANISRTILKNLRARLYNASSGSFVDGLASSSSDAASLRPIEHSSMHATLFPMMAGVADANAEPAVMGEQMLTFLKATGLRCSCMAAFWLLEGLYRTGLRVGAAADYALDVLTSSGQFSWLNMIAQGATCTTESWPSGTAPHSGLPPGRTWSHPWCAGPNSVIIRLLLGITPIELGWQRFSFTPQPSTLRTVNASVPILARGQPETVHVLLNQTDDTFRAVLHVPARTAASVCLPPAHGLEPAAAHLLLLNGQPVAAADQLSEGRMLCFKRDLPPGAYTLERRTAVATTNRAPTTPSPPPPPEPATQLPQPTQSPQPTPSPLPTPVVVFRLNESGLNTCYRIPVLAATQSGVLLAFAEERTVLPARPDSSCGDNGAGHNIVLKRSRDDGRTWSPLIRAVGSAANLGAGGVGFTNPMPFVLRNRVLLHYATLNNPSPSAHGETMQTWSDNDGASWSATPTSLAQFMPGPPYAGALPGPARGVQLGDGGRLIGCGWSNNSTVPVTTNKTEWERDVHFAAFAYYSDDEYPRNCLIEPVVRRAA
jgi:hypothetical protein